MDSLITAAARALAAGDPLGALNRVALRDDAPALALRGIAMAQLGDLVRAKALLRRAARAFGPKEAVARARCVVAEAEIALVSRDLTWPAKALDAARATLEAHGDRVNAAHARYLEVRRLLLIGRLDEAERTLAELDPAPFPPASRAAHELVVAGIAMRRLRTKAARAALARAEQAARQAGIPALMAEVESASLVLNTPAARLIARGEERLLLLDEVEALLASKALVVDACRHVVRDAGTVVSLERAPGVVRAGARAGRSVARRRLEEPRCWRGHSGRSTPTNRTARGCASKIGRLRNGAADAGRRQRDEARLCAGAAPRARGRGAGAAGRRGACGGARLPCRRRIVVELGAGAGARRQPAHRAAGARRSLRQAGKVQSVGRGRARRWMTPPVPGFPTTLLLPGSTLLGGERVADPAASRTRRDAAHEQSAAEIIREYGPFPGVDQRRRRHL